MVHKRANENKKTKCFSCLSFLPFLNSKKETFSSLFSLSKPSEANLFLSSIPLAYIAKRKFSFPAFPCLLLSLLLSACSSCPTLEQQTLTVLGMARGSGTRVKGGARADR